MIELLAPARDVEIGISAINCGADTVYIGAPQFGARSAAGNSLSDIERLVDYAHLFGCRVLVTLNTILSDHELSDANKMAWQLYNIGVDALIIQDFGLLETHLPPIRLHASTQCHNTDIEHIKWLEKIGFSRVVLARELSVEQIKLIREATTIELEAFIHGALCVSYSGQCYMSQALCNRSANRGVCAQMCRLPYDLLDSNGKEIMHQKHLLSLFDMDRSAYLKELIDAGVTTLKIEGRLKDENYVKNIVTYYRQQLDHLLGLSNSHQPWSSFPANPNKTFHRSGTDYFLHTRNKPLANFDTPKSTGEYVGRLISCTTNSITIDSNCKINCGDGICIGSEGFQAENVATINGKTIIRWNKQHSTIDITQLKRGLGVYRNYDSVFIDQLKHYTPSRKILIKIELQDCAEGFNLKMTTEGGISSQATFKIEKEKAKNAEKAQQTIITQLNKLGNTIFDCCKQIVIPDEAYFIPISVLNEWRRIVIADLADKCRNSYLRQPQQPINYASMPTNKIIDYRANIYNSKAAAFYSKCGAKTIEYAFEQNTNNQPTKVELMRCKYCIKYELGWCKKNGQQGNDEIKEPLFIRRGDKLMQLQFDCKNCQMTILSPNR